MDRFGRRQTVIQYDSSPSEYVSDGFGIDIGIDATSWERTTFPLEDGEDPFLSHTAPNLTTVNFEPQDDLSAILLAQNTTRELRGFGYSGTSEGTGRKQTSYDAFRRKQSVIQYASHEPVLLNAGKPEYRGRPRRQSIVKYDIEEEEYLMDPHSLSDLFSIKAELEDVCFSNVGAYTRT